MAFPYRFVVTTYNLWATDRWPQREPALREYLRVWRPDVLAVQEFRPETRAVLDEVLIDHQRIEDSFEGWTKEGNIYFSTSLFEKIEYGCEKIGIELHHPLRRLFWVRLRLKDGNAESNGGRTILVSTAHYTFQGHRDELATGQSPRPQQARQTVAALNRLAHPGEPVLFMGDLNDPMNALAVLWESGFRDCFQCLGVLPRPTWPTVPTAGQPKHRLATTMVLDWQFSRGPIRVMNADVGDFFLDDMAPSDHRPLTVTYGLDR